MVIGCKVDKSLGRGQRVGLKWNSLLNLAFCFLNMDRLFKNNYFRGLFSSTLNPFSPCLCVASLMFLPHGRNKAVSFQQELAADTETLATGYRCLQASLFSMSLVITCNFIPFFSWDCHFPDTKAIIFSSREVLQTVHTVVGSTGREASFKHQLLNEKWCRLTSTPKPVW